MPSSETKRRRAPWVGLLGFLLLCCAGGFVLPVGGVSLYIWLHRDEMRETHAEAVRYGREHTVLACVTDVAQRVDECSFVADVPCRLRLGVWAQACVQHAESDPDEWCASAPDSSAPLDTATFTLQECARLGHTKDQVCPQVVQMAVQGCDLRVRRLERRDG